MYDTYQENGNPNAELVCDAVRRDADVGYMVQTVTRLLEQCRHVKPTKEQMDEMEYALSELGFVQQ